MLATNHRERRLACQFLLAFLVSCVLDDATGQTQEVTYELSAAPEIELLSLYTSGGMSFYGPRYRLFGDGRLVREIRLKNLDRTLASEEAYLGPDDVRLLVDLIVAAQLPEMTPASLRASLGHEPEPATDASTSVLELRFETYQSPGGELHAPFTPRVMMLAPMLQARFAPGAPEPQGFITLREALDGYFPTAASEALREVARTGGDQ